METENVRKPSNCVSGKTNTRLQNLEKINTIIERLMRATIKYLTAENIEAEPMHCIESFLFFFSFDI